MIRSRNRGRGFSGGVSYIPFQLVELFYNPYMTNESGSMEFNIPLTPATLADPKVADKYEYINHMYVGTTTPNGYVLGTIIGPAPGRTFSISGLGLSVDSSSGLITLTDSTQFSTIGQKPYVLTVSDLGDIPFNVPCCDTNGVLGTFNDRIFFIDPVNGLDSNSGRQPHLPKRIYDKTNSATGMNFARNVMFKRGTTLTDCATITPYSPTTNTGSGTVGSYGDPSQPNPIIYTLSTNIYCIERAASGNWNVTIQDLDLYGGTDTERCISMVNTFNLQIKRVRCMANPKGGANAQGIYIFQTASGSKIRHCYTAAGITGDSLYGTFVNGMEVAFNDFASPTGGAADCVEFTSEQNPAQRCFNIWMHDNICRRDPASNSVKGAVVIEETTGWLLENNYLEGGYFSGACMGLNATIRNNYASLKNATISDRWGFGYGADQHGDSHKYHDNIVCDSSRGFIISGFPKGSYTWYRGDSYFTHNTCLRTSSAFRATERWTGEVTKNINILDSQGSPQLVGSGLIVASNIKTGSIARSGTTATFTVLSGVHNLTTGNRVTNTLATEPEYNGVFTIVRTSDTAFTFQVTGTPTTPATGTPTFTQLWDSTTQTTTGNIYQSGLGEDVARPTITGGAEEGETVTVSTTAYTGVTYEYEWRLNGLVISGETASSYTIPAGAAATIDRFRPTNNSLNAAELSCVVKAIKDGQARWMTAVWPSGNLYEVITV